MMEIYTSQDIAGRFGCSRIVVQKWAQFNGVSFIGEGRRKTYQFTKSDIVRFQARDTKRGRRWHNEG
jgi:hypothetical protein